MICLWSMMAWTCHKICLCCKTCYYLEIFLSVATSPVYTNIEMPEKRSTMQSQVGDDWMIPPSCRPQDIHRKRGIGHSECALQVAVSQNMAKYIYIYIHNGWYPFPVHHDESKNASMFFFPPIETRAPSSNHDHPGPSPCTIPKICRSVPLTCLEAPPRNICFNRA